MIARPFLFLLVISSLALPSGACKKGEDDAKKKAGRANDKVTSEKKDPNAEAQALAKELLIIDGHVDLPYRLYESRDEHGKPTEDVSQHTEKGQFDYPRAVAGGLDAPFWAIYLPAKLQDQPGASRERADELIDMVEGVVHDHSDAFALAQTPEAVEENFRNGKMSILLGMENGSALETDLANVQHFYDRGIRYITLTHSKCNAIGDSSYDKERINHGLTEFGKQVVAEMNRVGIMVDLAHVSDETFDDALAVATAPVIVSHSGLRHFTPGFERNLSDEMVKRVAATGGIVMINFGSMFIDGEAQKRSMEKWKAEEAYAKEKGLSEDDPEDEKQIKAYLEEKFPEDKFPRIRARLEQVADHIDRAVELAGIDHVGLGSDFDGVSNLPEGLEDVSKYPNLLRVLMQRGYSREELAKLCGGNLLRVWREVEAHAQQANRVTPT